MSLKENLLKKITINRLANEVLKSIMPPGSIQKIDIESMRALLEMSGYELRTERDLELYYRNHSAGTLQVIVLDNDLPLYHTTIEDVVLRKSPTVKEMISIRNAVRILSDSDVLVSKREDTLKTVQAEGIALLDLTFDASDLDALASEGETAYHENDPEGVIECITLFAELIGYRRAPKTMKLGDLHALGARTETGDGKILWGPLVMYHPQNNQLKLVVDQFESGDKERLNLLTRIASSSRKADLEGETVFQFLKKSALKQRT